VSRASREMIHVNEEAWVTRSVMRSAFFILGVVGVVKEVGGRVCVDYSTPANRRM
jgi:hypothetical protein